MQGIMLYVVDSCTCVVHMYACGGTLSIFIFIFRSITDGSTLPGTTYLKYEHNSARAPEN